MCIQRTPEYDCKKKGTTDIDVQEQIHQAQMSIIQTKINRSHSEHELKAQHKHRMEDQLS